MRNAVKKRMQKIHKEQRQQRIAAQQEEEKALRIVGKELKIKYPPGSFAAFTTTINAGEEPTSIRCAWYDKIGGPYPCKHIVSNPPEWQNLTPEEAEKIMARFEDHFYTKLVYHEPKHDFSV